MKNRFLITLFALLAAIFISVGARAEGVSSKLQSANSGYYFTVGYGVRQFFGDTYADSDLVISTDPRLGYLFSGGFGYDSGDGVRAGIEVSYSNNYVDFGLMVLDPDDTRSFEGIGGELEFWSFLLRGSYYFPLNTTFVPFVGAVVGYSRSEINFDGRVVNTETLQIGSFSDRNTDNLFSWGSVVGLRIPVNEKLSSEVEYSLIGSDVDDIDWSIVVQGRISYKF